MARKKPEDTEPKALFTPAQLETMQATAAEWQADGSGDKYRAWVRERAYLHIQRLDVGIEQAESVKELLAAMGEFFRVAGILVMDLEKTRK